MSEITLLTGDCLKILPTLPAESVQCVVTSPPYWGLRSYKTEPQIWLNGKEPCAEHQWNDTITVNGEMGNANLDISPYSTRGGSHKKTEWKGEHNTCSVCGAWRGELGLEPTVQMYVDHLIQIFREVKRVLRRDGTCWVNLGDSYSGSNGGKGDYRKDKSLQRDIYDFEKPQSRFSKWQSDTPDSIQVSHQVKGSAGLGAKQLVGVPWRFAFAMQEDGWILRSDIIWAKPNPMPESVRDRPTKSHEYIFLLAKSERYYYDQDAIREPYAEASLPRALRGLSENNKWTNGAPGSTAHTISQPRKNVRKQFEQEHGGGGSGFKGHSGYKSADGRLLINPLGRNKWSVWEVPTVAYKEAHFATFSPKLIEPCILAGSRPSDVVLDPFMGSGTTGLVSIQHHRNFIGIELNPEYVELAKARMAEVQQTLS